MTVASDYHSELYELAGAQCEGTMTADQAARLEELVLVDGRLRRMYILYMHVHACAEERGVGDQRRGMAGLPAIDGEAGFGVRESGFGIQSSESLSVGAAVELPHQLDPEPRSPIPEPPFPTLSTTHYPLPTSHFSVGSWAFSYMVATVIMGVAILGFWAYKITHHQHIAEAPSQSVPSDAGPEMVFVGRITGMVDVKWSDDSRYLPPPDFAHVPLGRKYILSSGLLEITYDSGAKVILEGPCTYEVESTAGGYLSLGKLTARVGEDKETRRQGDKEKKADAVSPHLLVSPSPGLPASPLFSVRTPTAVVTDLGTEFGVEVDESGVSKAHVFQGKVEVRLTSGGKEARAIQLGANESARVERAEDRLVIVRGAAPGKATHFVRSLRPKPADAPGIVEKFNGAELGVAFEQNPPRHYVFERGAAVYSPPLTDEGRGRQSRGYIRTVATDFCNRDFVFEATFQVRLDVLGEAGYHWIFFGIGDGVPNANYFDEVSRGLVLAFKVDDGRVFVRLCRPDTARTRKGDDNKIVAELSLPGKRLGVGRHRFRMSKTGSRIKFAVDADFEGQFHEDFVSPPIDLPATAPLLDAANSRLLVGTGCCDTMTVRFEELSITEKKGTGPICATTNAARRYPPPGRSGKLDLSPFSPGKEGTPMNVP